jgi:hypothetical protein
MNYLVAILITIIIVTPISWLWVKGIDNMKKNHPDYKGNDLFNWDEDDDSKNV